MQNLILRSICKSRFSLLLAVSQAFGFVVLKFNKYPTPPPKKKKILQPRKVLFRWLENIVRYVGIWSSSTCGTCVFSRWGEDIDAMTIDFPYVFCSWTLGPYERCIPWAMRPLDDASLRRLRTLDDASLGWCIPWTMHPLDDESLGRCILWMMRPRKVGPGCSIHSRINWSSLNSIRFASVMSSLY
jgi:hypothetical protein